MSFYRQTLEDFLKTLDVKASLVLDIGGKQKLVKGRTGSWSAGSYGVLDLPHFDMNLDWELSALKYSLPRADLIFCLEVFEYLFDPMSGMRNIRACLNQGGRAYVSFPLVYPVHNEVELDSLRYTESGIRRLAEAAGLEVDKVHYRRDRSGLLQDFYAADGMKAAQGHDHSITGYIAELVK